MAIHAGIYHLMRYKYDRPVTLGPQIIRLRPAPQSRTRVISHSLKVSPGGHFVNHQQDPYGNGLARFVFPEPARELKIEVDLVADMTVYNPFDVFVEDSAECWRLEYPPELQDDVVIYRTPEPEGPLLAKLLGTVEYSCARTADFLVDLNARIAKDIEYLIRMEVGVQSPEETLGKGSGSCRDSTWLLVQALRHLGFAARFVSGFCCSSSRTWCRSTGRRGPTTILPICMPGPRSSCPEPGGSGSTRPPVCWPVKATFRWPRRRISAMPRRSRAGSRMAGRASGTQARACRAGRFRCFGGATESRSGPTRA